MNLRALEYLQALKEQGSFVRASEVCHVSQPALSIQIKKLEEELGAVLLERHAKGFLFTPAGEEVLTRARAILQTADEIRRLAEVMADPYAGQLSIGAFPTLAPYYFPLIIDHLVDAYPNLRFNLVEEKTHVLLDRLHDGALDAALLAVPVENDSLEYGEIFTEAFRLGVSPKHAWCKRDRVDPSELAGQPLLLLAEGHCLRGQALDYCSKTGLNEVLNFRASSMETLLQMIAMNRAVSFVPDCVARRHPDLHYLKLKGGGAQRTIGLFWRKGFFRRDLMRELVDDLSREYTP
jgi:LysR family hydrogen peroxide-inducible transcriptional activator